MFDNDPFSQWLGIKRIEISKGKVVLEMKVREEMCNGFGIAHGGIAYSLADSALAFAANTHGKQAFSIETSIQHYSAIKLGELIRAETQELVLKEETAVYEVSIFCGEEKRAKFNGTVYRGKEWDL